MHVSAHAPVCECLRVSAYSGCKPLVHPLPRNAGRSRNAQRAGWPCYAASWNNCDPLILPCHDQLATRDPCTTRPCTGRAALPCHGKAQHASPSQAWLSNSFLLRHGHCQSLREAPRIDMFRPLLVTQTSYTHHLAGQKLHHWPATKPDRAATPPHWPRKPAQATKPHPHRLKPRAGRAGTKMRLSLEPKLRQYAHT